jgi:hypothetical protein
MNNRPIGENSPNLVTLLVMSKSGVMNLVNLKPQLKSISYSVSSLIGLTVLVASRVT